MSNFKESAAIAIGATFAAGLAATPFANAAENPFGMKSLTSGYQQLAAKDNGYKNMEGKCGEGKCGDSNKEMKKEKAQKKQSEGEEEKEMEQEQEMEQSE